MKTLIFRNAEGVDVRYKTDLIGENRGKFTVMSIEGLDTVEEEKLLQFQQLVYDFNDFKKFAVDNNLTLVIQEPSSQENINLEILVVTFDVAGGTPAPAVQNIATGSKATAPTAPTKALKVFGGWSLDGTHVFSFTTTPIVASITLTAIWNNA